MKMTQAGRLGLGALLTLCIALVAADVHVCFEKISDIPAIYLQEHPIGDALAVATQDGMIRLMVRPKVRSGSPAQNFSVFLDLTQRVYYSGEQGLLSFAFHPNFAKNGRFFVSYICDATQHPDCQGPCACSVATNCTGVPKDCPLNTIVAEYSAGPSPLNVTSLNSTEVRKILKFGRPGQSNNGGQIWFAGDGYLYFASGDGSSVAYPVKSAQNGHVLLGKILRLDVDKDGVTAGPYGAYGVPPTNPFIGNTLVRPEVYALGFRNPWRCSYDAPSKATLCGDIGPATTQLVQLVQRGSNYGWPNTWGPTVVAAQVVSIQGGSITGPLYEYDGLAVIGGYVYRAKRNPCLQNRYISGDEDGQTFLSAPFGSSSVFENATYSVAPEPQAPKLDANGMVISDAFPANDMLHSWGVDASNELYRLSSSGVYRVTDSEVCGGVCDPNLKNAGAAAGKKGASTTALLSWGFQVLVSLAAVLLLRF